MCVCILSIAGDPRKYKFFSRITKIISKNLNEFIVPIRGGVYDRYGITAVVKAKT